MRNRKPLLITAGIGAAVLMTIGVVVAVLVTSGGGVSGSGSRGGAGEVARTYLEALARGDAQAALALGASKPASAELLTDEVLRKQLDKMPISDIQILEESDQSADATRAVVRVAARLGEQRSEGSIQMLYRDGGWKLANAFVNVGTTGSSVESSATTTLTVFGKPIGRSGHFYVFPGYLEVGTATPYLQVNQPGPVGLDDITGVSAFIDFKFSMTEAGKAGAEESVREYLTKCFQPGAKPGYCTQFIGGTGWENYDLDSITLTGPIDLSGLEYSYVDQLRWASVSGAVEGIPIDIRTTDGQPESATVGVRLYLHVDLGEDPPVVLEGK